MKMETDSLESWPPGTSDGGVGEAEGVLFRPCSSRLAMEDGRDDRRGRSILEHLVFERGELALKVRHAAFHLGNVPAILGRGLPKNVCWVRIPNFDARYSESCTSISVQSLLSWLISEEQLMLSKASLNSILPRSNVSMVSRILLPLSPSRSAQHTITS